MGEDPKITERREITQHSLLLLEDAKASMQVLSGTAGVVGSPETQETFNRAVGRSRGNSARDLDLVRRVMGKS